MIRIFKKFFSLFLAFPSRYKVIFHLMKNVRGSCVLISTWSYSSEPSVATGLSVKRLRRNCDEDGESCLPSSDSASHARIFLLQIYWTFRIYTIPSYAFILVFRRSWQRRRNVINAPTLTSEKYTLVSSMPRQPLISLTRAKLSFWKTVSRILRWLFYIYFVLTILRLTSPVT